jgi:hypothetical protein
MKASQTRQRQKVTAGGPKQSSQTIYDDEQAEREEGHRGTDEAAMAARFPAASESR